MHVRLGWIVFQVINSGRRAVAQSTASQGRKSCQCVIRIIHTKIGGLVIINTLADVFKSHAGWMRYLIGFGVHIAWLT